MAVDSCTQCTRFSFFLYCCSVSVFMSVSSVYILSSCVPFIVSVLCMFSSMDPCGLN